MKGSPYVDKFDRESKIPNQTGKGNLRTMYETRKIAQETSRAGKIQVSYAWQQ